MSHTGAGVLVGARVREDLLVFVLTVQRGLSHQLFRDPTRELVAAVLHPYEECWDDVSLVRLARLLVADVLGIGSATPLNPEAGVVRHRVLENCEGLLVSFLQ